MTNQIADPVVLRRAEIIAHPAVSLDGQKNAMDWLQKPSPTMGGRTPLEVLSEGAGDMGSCRP